MTQCEICQEMGNYDCQFCGLGNPCLDCEDYDIKNDMCKSNGGCGDDKTKD